MLRESVTSLPVAATAVSPSLAASHAATSFLKILEGEGMGLAYPTLCNAKEWGTRCIVRDRKTNSREAWATRPTLHIQESWQSGISNSRVQPKLAT